MRHLHLRQRDWRTKNISKSYVGSILRFALLAPGIVEAILAGRMSEQELM
jgi:hypothetical protein